jgi:hypothetical protein
VGVGLVLVLVVLGLLGVQETLIVVVRMQSNMLNEM